MLRPIPLLMSAPAWIAYAASLNWWENSTHSEAFLKYGKGANAVYQYGGMMALLATALVWVLTSTKTIKFKAGVSLTLLSWITFFGQCWHWEVIVTSRWTEQDWLVDIGFGYFVVYLAGAFTALFLTLVGLGISGILSLLWRLNRQAYSLSNEIGNERPPRETQ